MSADNLAFIPTRSSLLKRKSPPEFQAVIFEARKPKVKKMRIEKLQDDLQPEKSNVLNMRRARHEIVKFGMSGFDPDKKEEAKVKLAISLGARPPKNKYKNYKQLQEEKRKEIDTEKCRLDFQHVGKNQLGKCNTNGKFIKRKNEKGGFLDKYGKTSLKEIAKKETGKKKR